MQQHFRMFTCLGQGLTSTCHGSKPSSSIWRRGGGGGGGAGEVEASFSLRLQETRENIADLRDQWKIPLESLNPLSPHWLLLSTF